jgi:hypothetical protein
LTRSSRGGDAHHAVLCARHMSRRTGPTPAPRHTAQLGPDRIEFHVPGRPQQIALVHRKRGESSLPQVPAPALPEVDPACVAPVRLPQAPPQPVLALRHHDQMHVVGHQAVRPHRHATAGAPLAEQGQICAVVFLLEEGLLSPIPALRHVVGDPWNHNSRQSCHAQSLPHARPRVNHHARI